MCDQIQECLSLLPRFWKSARFVSFVGSISEYIGVCSLPVRAQLQKSLQRAVSGHHNIHVWNDVLYKQQPPGKTWPQRSASPSPDETFRVWHGRGLAAIGLIKTIRNCAAHDASGHFRDHEHMGEYFARAFPSLKQDLWRWAKTEPRVYGHLSRFYEVATVPQPKYDGLPLKTPRNTMGTTVATTTIPDSDSVDQPAGIGGLRHERVPAGHTQDRSMSLDDKAAWPTLKPEDVSMQVLAKAPLAAKRESTVQSTLQPTKVDGSKKTKKTKSSPNSSQLATSPEPETSLSREVGSATKARLSSIPITSHALESEKSAATGSVEQPPKVAAQAELEPEPEVDEYRRLHDTPAARVLPIRKRTKKSTKKGSNRKSKGKKNTTPPSGLIHDSSMETGTERLCPGSKVEIDGLTSEKGAPLNGIRGKVASYDEISERYEIRFKDRSKARKTISLKRGNLTKVIGVAWEQPRDCRIKGPTCANGVRYFDCGS